MNDLVKRLRATRKVRYTVSARDDDDLGPTELPFNPDGPEAAALIEELTEALERLMGATPVVAAYGEHPMSDCDCPFCQASAALTKAQGDGNGI